MKKILCLLTSLVTAASLMVSLPASAEIISDDNNTSIDTAKAISFDTNYSITYEANSKSYLDYYVKVTLPSNGYITAVCSRPVIEQEYKHIRLHVYNSSGTEISQQFTHDNLDENLTFNLALKKGTYYINIQNDFGYGTNEEEVTLNYKVAFKSGDYEIEPNNGIATATPISLGKTYTAFIEPDANDGEKVDFFKFVIPSARKVRFYIGNYNTIKNDTNFNLISSDGSSYTSYFHKYIHEYIGNFKSDSSASKFNSSNNSMKIMNNGTGYVDKYLAAGTYYIEVGSGYGKNISYSINVSNMPVTTPTIPTTTTRNASVVAKEKAAAVKAMKQAKITKLKVKSKAKKKINATWKKVKKAVGYEVQVSTNKKFKSSKIIYDKTVKKIKLNIKNKKIKSKKTYYVRVRAYATYKDTYGKTMYIYSKWNKVLRKVKVK